MEVFPSIWDPLEDPDLGFQIPDFPKTISRLPPPLLSKFRNHLLRPWKKILHGLSRILATIIWIGLCSHPTKIHSSRIYSTSRWGMKLRTWSGGIISGPSNTWRPSATPENSPHSWRPPWKSDGQQCMGLSLRRTQQPCYCHDKGYWCSDFGNDLLAFLKRVVIQNYCKSWC